MTLGGEGDCGVSSSCLLLPLAVLSRAMEEEYGDHVGEIGSLGYEAKRAGIAPALCYALGRAEFSWHTAGLHVVS
jgi:hypothetical protein